MTLASLQGSQKADPNESLLSCEIRVEATWSGKCNFPPKSTSFSSPEKEERYETLWSPFIRVRAITKGGTMGVSGLQ